MNDMPDGNYYFNATISHCAPLTLDVQNVDIPDGETGCFNARQTITVAGGGTTFTIDNGGSATMIAGRNIIYLPTSTVSQGSYLHGYITTNGVYCAAQPPSLVAVIAGNEEIQPFREDSEFRLWPNPTTGNFTIELVTFPVISTIQVDIFSSLGEKILARELYGASWFTLSLSGRPAGLDFVRVATTSGVKTAKIIKQ